MSTPNTIDATLTAEDRTAIEGHLTAIEAALPFLADLTPDERRSLPKMGDKSRAFVERTLGLARQDDSFLPRSLDVDAFGKDLALWQALDGLRSRVARLLELIDDTQIAAGSEAYLAALEVYAAAKRSGSSAGLDDLLDRVGQRFTSRRSESATPSA